jgi:hypothetical protein
VARPTQLETQVMFPLALGPQCRYTASHTALETVTVHWYLLVHSSYCAGSRRSAPLAAPLPRLATGTGTQAATGTGTDSKDPTHPSHVANLNVRVVVEPPNLEPTGTGTASGTDSEPLAATATGSGSGARPW